VGIIGAGRIGSAYARMMVEGHKVSRPLVWPGLPVQQPPQIREGFSTDAVVRSDKGHFSMTEWCRLLVALGVRCSQAAMHCIARLANRFKTEEDS